MRIAGVDEAGRGPLAGPVVAAAVVLPDKYKNPEITDSKKLSAKKREQLYVQICSCALDYSIVAVGHRRIDYLNILQATRLAMRLAVARVNCDYVIIDGNTPIDIALPQEVIVGGDRLRLEISAASILAKVWRDRLMQLLDRRYPGYGLGKHAGYPTVSHRAAITALGPTRIHRLSFAGVREHADRLCQVRSQHRALQIDIFDRSDRRARDLPLS